MGNAINPESLTLGQSAFFDETGHVIFVSSTPSFLFDKDNKVYTDKRIGTKIEVVIPQQKYERMFVQLPVVVDDIEPNTKLRFEGFSAHFYRDFTTGEYFLTAKADKVIVVK